MGARSELKECSQEKRVGKGRKVGSELSKGEVSVGFYLQLTPLLGSGAQKDHIDGLILRKGGGL